MRTRSKSEPLSLSRRERQIMEIVYRLGRATASEVCEQLPDAPTYTTTRGLLRILEQKGHLAHDDDGVRYVYYAVAPKRDTGASMLAHVVRTFFDDSPSRAVAALLGSAGTLDADELQQLEKLVEQARKKERS